MPYNKKIILISGDESLINAICLESDKRKYKLQIEIDPISGYRSIQRHHPNFIILDTHYNGIELCRHIKNNPELISIPLIIIMENELEAQTALTLNLGADDYITRPFSVEFLFEHIRIMSSRNRPLTSVPATIIFGNFTLELDRLILQKNNSTIPLTISELTILKYLLLRRGEIVTIKQLLEDLQKDDLLIERHNLPLHITALETKLGMPGKFIEFIQGIGYRIQELFPLE
ncbi:MAG: response regulator transcription factor [Chlamydiales bacterium]